MSKASKIMPKKIPAFVDLVSSEDEDGQGGTSNEYVKGEGYLLAEPVVVSRPPLGAKRVVKAVSKSQGSQVQEKKGAKSGMLIKSGRVDVDVKPIIVSDDGEDDLKAFLSEPKASQLSTAVRSLNASEESRVLGREKERAVGRVKVERGAVGSGEVVSRTQAGRVEAETWGIKREVMDFPARKLGGPSGSVGVKYARSPKKTVDIKPVIDAQSPERIAQSGREAYRTPRKIISDASDEEDDEFPPVRTPFRSRRKVIVQSDSDEDEKDQVGVRDRNRGLGSVGSLDGMKGLRLEDEDEEDGSSGGRNVREADEDEDEDEDEEGDEDEDTEDEDEENDGSDDNDEYDLEKHYDTSLGSLRDFIVDDSGNESDTAQSDTELRRFAHDIPRDDEEAQMSEGYVSSSTCPSSDSEAIAVYTADDGEGCSDDEGILHHTPERRPVVLPDFSWLTLADYPVDESDSSTPERGAQPRPRAKTDTKPGEKDRLKERKSIAREPISWRNEKAWKVERERIAMKIFRDLNKRVFEGRLADVEVLWNKRLTTTAGQAHRTGTKHPDGTRTWTYFLTLSEKVLTGEEQIMNTVAHEMCHVACWLISNEFKNPHGKVFKSWGRKVMRARPDIEVTTTHNYTIEFKYHWKCENETCWVTYRRHSRSIDVTKEVCWRCRGRLVPQFQTRSSNPFQAYLKANMAAAKAAMPGAKHGDVMRALSKRWADDPAGDHQAHWRALRA